jgi:hypothetical protein
MTRTSFVLALGATLLASAAHADSIKGQENAEIAYCMIETNTTSGRTNKIARDRHNACLKAHGWLPNSGTPEILPPAASAQMHRGCSLFCCTTVGTRLSSRGPAGRCCGIGHHL